jgi:hypothetical protein
LVVEKNAGGLDPTQQLEVVVRRRVASVSFGRESRSSDVYHRAKMEKRIVELTQWK